MPTDQQLEMKLKKQTKKYGTNKQHWTVLKMEDMLELFCTDCRTSIERLFAGNWVYVVKGYGKKGERLRKIEIIHHLIKEDYDRKQIAEKMGFKSQQHLQYYFNLMDKE